MKKNKLILISLAIFVMTIAFYTLKKDQEEQGTNKNIIGSTAESKKQINLKNISQNANVIAPQPMRSLASVSVAGIDHRQYFEKSLLAKDNVKNIYQNTLKILPLGKNSELIAEYIAEGITRNLSSDFQLYMKSLHNDLNNNTDALYEILTKNEDQLKEDPFVYQMVLNMAAAAKFSPEQKVRLLGGGIATSFKIGADNEMDDTAYNITNAMIHLKNSNLPDEAIRPYLEKGAQINKSNPEAFKEFKARANSYFPTIGI